MKQLLYMPCQKPPPFSEILSGATRRIPYSLFVHEQDVGRHMSMTGFMHSAAFLIFALFLGIAAARELAYSLSRVFGISGGVIAVVIFVFLLEIYRRTGFQCTVWAWMQLFMLVIHGTEALPGVAQSAVGDAIPILKELPGASEEKPADPRLQCFRLAACRAAPIYDNHLEQRQKFEKCEECLSKDMGFTSKWNEDKFVGYVCSADVEKGYRKCMDTPSASDECPMTADVLEIIGSEESVIDVCNASNGQLCTFAKKNGTYFGFAGEVDFVASDAGLGYPTIEICEGQNPGAECVSLENCEASDKRISTNCFCNQYRTVAQYKDPCAFLMENCDENSSAYREAVIQLKQQDIEVSDIISVDDVQGLVAKLDTALGL